MRELQPAENMAVTVARGIVSRGEDVGPNVVGMLLLTIERLQQDSEAA